MSILSSDLDMKIGQAIIEYVNDKEYETILKELQSAGSAGESTEHTIPVNTRDTPECGSSVSPRYFLTVTGMPVIFAPVLAPKYFPKALAAM